VAVRRCRGGVFNFRGDKLIVEVSVPVLLITLLDSRADGSMQLPLFDSITGGSTQAMETNSADQGR
jgi:hypothetical protein